MQKNIVIAFLVIIILILSFCLYSAYKYKKIDNTNNKKAIVDDKLDIISSDLINFIDNNEIRRFLAIKKNPSNYIFTNAMFDSDMVLWAVDRICGESECPLVKTSNLDKIFENTFNLKNLAYNDYVCSIDNEVLYKFNSEKKVYETTFDKRVHNHDRIYTYFEPIRTKLYSITKRGKDYIIVLYELYYDLYGGNFISDTMDGANSFLNPKNYLDISSDEVDINRIIHDYETNFEEDKHAKHIYTFRENDNGFYLYKYELEKP